MARVHGQGRIFRRGRRWWVAYYHQGREVREPSRSTNGKVAERLLKDRLGAIYAGTFIGPPQARVTVADLLETLRVEMEARGLKGWYAIKGIFPRLRAALGHQRVTDVTPDVLLRYELDLRASGLAPATRQNYFWLLKAAFKLGLRYRRIAVLPEFPRLRAIPNARQGFVEPEVFAEILGHLPPVGREIAAFAYASAWRQAEVLGLTWDVVDRRGQEIRLSDTKNGRPRVLALTGELARIVEGRWAGRVVGDRMVPWVFSHRSGRPVAPTTLRHWWRAAAAAAGHPGLIFHDLRRSGVRNMIRAGVSEPVAMSISGHRSPAVFRRYNITTVDDQRRALAATQAYAMRRRGRLTDKTRTIGRCDES
ncbi:MAG TPA: site-specific integrase [Methylomirabilota bacterium]|nr:site-specific integrase [Methylomirabilota bacterium]